MSIVRYRHVVRLISPCRSLNRGIPVVGNPVVGKRAVVGRLAAGPVWAEIRCTGERGG